MMKEQYGDSYGEKFRKYEDSITELQKEVNEWKTKYETLERKCKFNFIDLLEDVEKENKQDKRITELENQIGKMKSDSKTAYIKGIRTMANALKKYDRTEGACTDYFEHTVDKVLKSLLEGVK